MLPPPTIQIDRLREGISGVFLTDTLTLRTHQREPAAGAAEFRVVERTAKGKVTRDSGVGIEPTALGLVSGDSFRVLVEGSANPLPKDELEAGEWPGFVFVLQDAEPIRLLGLDAIAWGCRAERKRPTIR